MNRIILTLAGIAAALALLGLCLKSLERKDMERPVCNTESKEGKVHGKQ